MTLISAGWNQFGQLGREGDAKTPSPVDFPPSEYRSISVGQLHTIIIDSKGDVYGWGSNEDGGLGFKELKEIRKPKKIEVSEKITLSSCGYCNTVLLSETGNVFIINDEGIWKANMPEQCIYVCSGYYIIWAIGRSGKIYQCGDTADSPPITYSMSSPAVTMSAGNGFAVAITEDGEAYGTGEVVSNSDEQAPENSFIKIDSLKNVRIKKLSAFDGHCIAVAKNGKVFVWGNGGQGKLGTGNCDNSDTFQQITSLDSTKIIDAGAGTSHSCFVSESGFVYGCGSNENGQALFQGSDMSNVPIKSSVITGCVAVQCGGHTLAIINGKPPTSSVNNNEDDGNDEDEVRVDEKDEDGKEEKTKGASNEENGKKGGKSSCCLLI